MNRRDFMGMITGLVGGVGAMPVDVMTGLPVTANVERLPVSIYAGLDLGQVSDMSALVVCQKKVHTPKEPPKVQGMTLEELDNLVAAGARRPPPGYVPPHERTIVPKIAPHYDVVFIHRWEKNTPYPEVVDNVIALYENREVLQGSQLVVDQTGVGRAVVDMFRKAKPRCVVRPITITAGKGAKENPEDAGWNVSKLELVSTLLALVGCQRVKCKQSPWWPVVMNELHAFSSKITRANNETFEAAGSQQHDDLVLAMALALWVAERGSKQFWVK